MLSKLNITLNETIIAEAKKYARANGKSLSKIVEEYLKSLVYKSKNEFEFEVSPIVKSLWGSVKVESDSVNYKDMVAEELIKKYRND